MSSLKDDLRALLRLWKRATNVVGWWSVFPLFVSAFAVIGRNAMSSGVTAWDVGLAFLTMLSGAMLLTRLRLGRKTGDIAEESSVSTLHPAQVSEDRQRTVEQLTQQVVAADARRFEESIANPKASLKAQLQRHLDHGTELMQTCPERPGISVMSSFLTGGPPTTKDDVDAWKFDVETTLKNEPGRLAKFRVTGRTPLGTYMPAGAIGRNPVWEDLAHRLKLLDEIIKGLD